ncbi:hypothetical protein QBC38DRAFT_523760, partial [Podospora fimiseda]
CIPKALLYSTRSLPLQAQLKECICVLLRSQTRLLCLFLLIARLAEPTMGFRVAIGATTHTIELKTKVVSAAPAMSTVAETRIKIVGLTLPRAAIVTRISAHALSAELPIVMVPIVPTSTAARRTVVTLIAVILTVVVSNIAIPIVAILSVAIITVVMPIVVNMVVLLTAAILSAVKKARVMLPLLLIACLVISHLPREINSCNPWFSLEWILIGVGFNGVALVFIERFFLKVMYGGYTHLYRVSCW